MPYNFEAVDWSDRSFDHTYVTRWWPASLPTLILSGSRDRIVDQTLWEGPKFQGRNVLQRTLAGGAHFLWIEKPEAVREAFAELAAMIQAAGSSREAQAR